LSRRVVGKVIDRPLVLRPIAVRTHTAAAFARAVRGAAVIGVARHGKSLWFPLGRSTRRPRPVASFRQIARAEWVLVFHYKLWGVVRFHSSAASPDKGTTLMLVFTDGSALEFRELQLSSFRLLRPGRASEEATRGVEPLAPSTTFSVFRRAIGSRGVVKDALCAQERIAGIGNLWAHEILFQSRIRPDRKVQSLTAAEAHILYRKMRETLRNAVSAGGEPDFRDATGRAGRYRLAVYGRAGQPCVVCGTKIRGTRLHGRPSFYCPHDQT
jgi:formamidopyrimidine-DNA glycosylase